MQIFDTFFLRCWIRHIEFALSVWRCHMYLRMRKPKKSVFNEIKGNNISSSSWTQGLWLWRCVENCLSLNTQRKNYRFRNVSNFNYEIFSNPFKEFSKIYLIYVKIKTIICVWKFNIGFSLNIEFNKIRKYKRNCSS